MPQNKCTKKQSDPKQSRRLTIPCTLEEYQEAMRSPQTYRTWLAQKMEQFPPLFPPAMLRKGYVLHDMRKGKKLEVKVRRVAIVGETHEVYTIAPSFAMPYLTGYTMEVEKPLLLHFKFGVPLEALVYVFGRDESYWYRLTTSLGRSQLVATTVWTADNLPDNLLADEKHFNWQGETGYAAMTVGQECVLGLSVSETASTSGLTTAYGVFKAEAQQVNPAYTPATVNTDGWGATQQAWRILFPLTIIVECFLHAFIKIRNCCRSLGADKFHELSAEVWAAYQATTPAEFEGQISYLTTWATHFLEGTALEAVQKLVLKAPKFALAYHYPEAHRTSNMLDRHMLPLERWLAHGFYCRGGWLATEQRFRAWALVHNFAHYTPRSFAKCTAPTRFLCPVHRLNGSLFHENWLQNLLAASSRSTFSVNHKIRTT